MTNLLLLLGNSFPYTLDGTSFCELSTLVIPSFLTKHTGLQLPRNVERMRFNYKYVAIVYGIVCEVTNKIYVGSTWDPVKRFNKHLIQLDTNASNIGLQNDIAKHGLESLTVYVFTKVAIDRGLPTNERKQILREAEQNYIDLFTAEQLYNTTDSARRIK